VRRQLERIALMLERYGLRCVIETGARFVLDPRRKHFPTLLEPGEELRRVRREFILAAIDIARRLRADAVSIWSGARPASNDSDEVLMRRLTDECRRLCEVAEAGAIRIGFEPEPGMFLERMSQFEELHGRVGHELLGLTLDVGHVYCLSDGQIEDHIRQWARMLFNVHIEDMRRGVHEHLMFGEGEIDIGSVLGAIKAAGYAGGVHVELSRHSHDAVRTAARAFDYLEGCMRKPQ
jgi:sugar phosphate isomerase/epimerase